MRAAILQLALFQISKNYHKFCENFVPTFCKGLGLSGFCKKFGLFFWIFGKLVQEVEARFDFWLKPPTHPSLVVDQMLAERSSLCEAGSLQQMCCSTPPLALML